MTEHNEDLTSAGIEDEPVVPDPDEFETGDPEEEFDFLDGVDVPDPDNADEEEEADENDFPDDVEGGE